MWHISTNTQTALYKILYWSGDERDISATIYFDCAKSDGKNLKFYRKNVITGSMSIDSYGHEIAIVRELQELGVFAHSRGLK